MDAIITLSVSLLVEALAKLSAAFAAVGLMLAFVGCVPGEATVTAKSSEIDKAMKGEIGWVKVAEHLTNAYENVALTGLTERAYKELKMSPTNHVADAVAELFKGFDELLPLYLHDDETVKYGSSVSNGLVFVWLDAELKVPIAKTNVLAKADLNRILQLGINAELEVKSYESREAKKFTTVTTVANAFLFWMMKEDCEKNLKFASDMTFWGLQALTCYEEVISHGVRMEDLSGEFILVKKDKKIRVERRAGN